MGKPSYTSLVAAENKYWLGLFSTILMDKGCDVHTASGGVRAADLIRKHRYDVVVADNSIGEAELIEFAFNLRDLASPMPVTLIAGDELEKHERLWRRINVYFTGGRTDVAMKLSEALVQVGRRRNRG